MKAWEKLYKQDDLEEALKLADSISIVSNDGVEIIAEVDSFRVRTYIQYDSPTYPSCDCSSRFSCKHEAGLTYYLQNHPELYSKSPDLDELLDSACVDDLKDFLLREFIRNPDLKDRFIESFSLNPINRNYYEDKLSGIFKRGEGEDFSFHEYYDLDLMADDLNDFISTDISEILSLGEYDLACDLILRISKLLNDEIMTTYDSWYDLSDQLMEYVNLLMFSIHIDAERIDELYKNMDVISNHF